MIVICHEKDEFGDEHGEFEIRAGNHMAGVGCPKCAKKYKPTTEEWIKRAKKVHGEKYNYTKVNYINQKTTDIDRLLVELTYQVEYLKEYKQKLIADVVTGKHKKYITTNMII